MHIYRVVRHLVDVGTSVAANLDAAAPLNSKLIEIESALAAWREELEEDLLAAERSTAERLASMLNQPADSNPTDLLALTAQRKAVSDPRLDKLRSIAEDWQARFGRS